MLLVSEPRTFEAQTMLDLQATAAERRRGLRVRQHRPIKVFDPGSHRYFGGETKDISSTGLRVELPVSTPVNEGRLLSIHVGLNHSGEALANRRHMMPARIVWIRRSPDRNEPRMLVGLELVSSVAARLDAA